MDSSEPIKNRYLWGSTSTTDAIPLGSLISDRYRLVAPNIWLDNRPQMLPEIEEALPEEVFPYLRLYPYRLHLPEVQTIVELASGTKVILLDNVPIDRNGTLMPSIIDAWAEASSLRKVYWLSQILELWEPLASLQLASSLLMAENLRVDGWRLRLVQLDWKNPTPASLDLQKLGKNWKDWFSQISSPINPDLEQIYQLLQIENISPAEVKEELDRLLVWEARERYFQVKVAGASDIGTQRQQNEDFCYPLAADIQNNPSLATSLAIVCDGVGGHDAGEVASSLAVSSIKLQLQALLTELALEKDFISPQIIAEVLRANVRVANNLILARNQEQGRDLRRKMATTIVMAVQLSQASGEVYIVHVGDSRAYWLSAAGVVQLTVDDNVATELVSEGKNLMAQAAIRQDAAALTQALGVRPGEHIEPRVTRLMLEEEGLLLLCSDGLSDNELLELHGREYAQQVLLGNKSVNEALNSLIDFANGYNGHDNISGILMHFQPALRPSEPEPMVNVPEKAVAEVRAPVLEVKPPAIAAKVSPNRSIFVTFAIAGLAIAAAVILALAMLADRFRQPQIERSPAVENPK